MRRVLFIFATSPLSYNPIRAQILRHQWLSCGRCRAGAVQKAGFGFSGDIGWASVLKLGGYGRHCEKFEIFIDIHIACIDGKIKHISKNALGIWNIIRQISAHLHFYLPMIEMLYRYSDTFSMDKWMELDVFYFCLKICNNRTDRFVIVSRDKTKVRNARDFTDDGGHT